MKLYCAPGTISVAVAVALEEADLPHEQIRVDFATGEQTAAPYLKVNPKGRVPALVTDENTVLTEVGAILEYIAAQAPSARLVPAGAQEAAHMRAVMYYLASTMHVAHAHKMRGPRWARLESSFEDMRSKVTENMADAAGYVESHCLRGDFVLGATFSIADAYLFAVCRWLEGDGVALGDFPAIAAFLDRMQARPSVVAVRASGLI
ncbi:MAG: glutathione S-transferase family protein [Pseudomonadota bacterium]